MTGDIYLNSKALYLSNNTFHSIKYNGTYDGPSIIGFTGGSLGTNSVELEFN
jgi:hypothetical protein